jgi:hypothetical protein
MKFTDLHFPVQPLSARLGSHLVSRRIFMAEVFHRSLFLQGPAGRLEAMLWTPASANPDLAAIVCHPHPLFGGTMHNKVVERRKRCTGAEFLSCDLTFAAPARARANTTKGAANETTCAQVLIF